MIKWVPGETLDKLIIEATRLTLIATKGNKKKAAELLGISPRTIFGWVRKYPELKPYKYPWV